MIHLYCGDGKGKTTAAMGLALRAAGRGRGVVIAQFLKGEDTGERRALSSVPGVVLLPVPERVTFTFRMDEEERAECRRRTAALLAAAETAMAAPGVGLVVLDEICAAVNAGMAEESAVLTLLERLPAGADAVLTGRDPPASFCARADYLTEMRALRHPYQRGVAAREGIEY